MSVPEKGNITGVMDLLTHIGYSPLVKEPDAHLRLWYRGQADISWPLQPGVYRSTFPAKDENARLALERQLAQDFRVESAGILTRETNESEQYFIQQHYRMPTRLLDWTGNPLAALYFAVKEEEHKLTNGALFMMDACSLAETQKAAGFSGVATGRHPVFTTAMRRIHRWEDSCDFPGFIFPVRPDRFDKRMTLQRSGFTFHVPKHGTLTDAENKSLIVYMIPAKRKTKLRDELFLLGVDEFSIYGDLDSLSRRLKDAYKIR
jgi:hypothetical protein